MGGHAPALFTSLGFTACVSPAPCDCASPAGGQLSKPPHIGLEGREVLWDGNDGENREASGWASCKEKETCAASLASMPGVGTNGSVGLKFHGEGPGWIGAGWNWDGLLAPIGRNISAFGALSFSLRVVASTPEEAPASDRLWMSLAGPPERRSRTVLIQDCAGHFMDGAWHRVVIPLSELYQKGDPSFDPASVFGIWFYTSGVPRRSFDLYVDDVAVEQFSPSEQRSLCGGARLDYAALPNLPEYPCEPATLAASPANPPTTASSAKPPSATGALSPAEIASAFRANFPSLIDCYKAGLTERLDLGGRVTVRFSVTPAGAAEGATAVCTSLPDPVVVKCVVDAVTRLRFPASARGAQTVTYPVLLKPNQ